MALHLFDRLKQLAGQPSSCRTRYELLNHLIRTRGYRHYLEIGVFRGTCFRRIRCADKVGVDPNPQVVKPGWNVHRVPSDEFFAANQRVFDLVFIDGLHLAEQVVRDVVHSLQVLRPGGAVVLHDCNPIEEAHQVRSSAALAEDAKWNGDVWKAFAFLRAANPGWFTRVLNVDEGLGIVVPSAGSSPPELTPALETAAARAIERLDYSDLRENRAEMLGLCDNWPDLEGEMTAFLARASMAA